MCGIVGYLNYMSSADRTKYGKNTTDLFKDLIYADTLRGADGTGVIYGNYADSEPDTYKRALAGHDFLMMPKVKDIAFCAEKYDFVIAHNRYTTVGGNKLEAMHPHVVGHISLVHNGTLRNYYSLPEYNWDGFISDSYLIAQMLASKGVEYTVKSIEGAFALVWYDAKEKSVNFIRNTERPLAIGALGAGMIGFSSEPAMLQWVAKRNLWAPKDIVEIEPGHLISFKQDGKPTVKKLNLHVPKPVNTGITYHSGGGMQDTMKSGTGSNNPRRFPSPFSSLQGYSLMYGTHDLLAFGYGKDERIDVHIDRGEWLENTQEGLKVYRMGGYEVETGQKVIVERCKAHVMPHGYVSVKVHGIAENQQTGDTKLLCNALTILPETEQKVLKEWEEDRDREIDTASIEDEEMPSNMLIGPNNKLIPVTEWLSLTKRGCSMCTCNLLEDDADDIYWDSNNNPFCPECVVELHSEARKQAKQRKGH